MHEKISVIIPFLNEQEEVKNTIKSILEFSDGDVGIIYFMPDNQTLSTGKDVRLTNY